MCGVFGISKPENITETFLVDPFGRWEASYNIRPTQPAPLLTKNSPLTGHIGTFGFVPHWSKELKPKLMPFNAKSETVATSGYFKAAFLNSRCIIPAEFWFEFMAVEVDGEKIKQPYAFKVKDQDMFAFAGIYSQRTGAEKEEYYNFAILTTKPNKTAAKIHPRMPVVLKRDEIDIWLDKETKPEKLHKLLKPYDDSLMESWRVSRLVNSNKNDGEELIRKID